MQKEKEIELLKKYNELLDKIKELEVQKQIIWNKLVNEHELNNGQIIYRLGKLKGLK